MPKRKSEEETAPKRCGDKRVGASADAAREVRIRRQEPSSLAARQTRTKKNNQRRTLIRRRKWEGKARASDPS